MHDATVVDACEFLDLIPEDCFVLFDSGLTTVPMKVLTPYSGRKIIVTFHNKFTQHTKFVILIYIPTGDVRYHLKVRTRLQFVSFAFFFHVFFRSGAAMEASQKTQRRFLIFVMQ